MSGWLRSGRPSSAGRSSDRRDRHPPDDRPGGFLLLSGIRRVLEVNWDSGDGRFLRGKTGIPQFLWFLLWLAGTLGAVAIGGEWLVMRS